MPFALENIRAIDTAGAYPNEDLPGPRPGPFSLCNAQDLGGTVGTDLYHVHHLETVLKVTFQENCQEDLWKHNDQGCLGPSPLTSREERG